MMGLSDGRKSFAIGLAVLIQYRSVTASQLATQPASHVAVAITLNAKASSLKTGCWFVGGDDLNWSSAHLIAPVVTSTSIILSSNKIQNGDILVLAILDSLENGC